MLTTSHTHHIIYWLICFKFFSLLSLKTGAIFIQNWFRAIFSRLIWNKTPSSRNINCFPLFSYISKFNIIFSSTDKRSTWSIYNIPSTIRWISWVITSFLPLIDFIYLRLIDLIHTASLRYIILKICCTNNRFINLFNLINSIKGLISTFTYSTDRKKLHKHKATHRYKWTS